MNKYFKQKSFVLAILPNTGLGNKMLTWSRAYSFSKKYNLPLKTKNWVTFSPGVYFRNERSFRFYNYFKNQGLVNQIQINSLLIRKKTCLEPKTIFNENLAYVFKDIFIEKDYFRNVRKYRLNFKSDFFELLKPKVLSKIEQTDTPGIALHIRRGDFHRGSTLTDISFFVEVLYFIRNNSILNFEVTVFSDGTDQELSELLKLPGVKRAKKQEDIIDLFQMSKSQIFIPSIGSTFSYWVAFLTEGIVVRHPTEWHPKFKNVTDDKEFVFGFDNERLKLELSTLIKK
jgi:hypothetical protein